MDVLVRNRGPITDATPGVPDTEKWVGVWSVAVFRELPAIVTTIREPNTPSFLAGTVTVLLGVGPNRGDVVAFGWVTILSDALLFTPETSTVYIRGDTPRDVWVGRGDTTTWTIFIGTTSVPRTSPQLLRALCFITPPVTDVDPIPFAVLGVNETELDTIDPFTPAPFTVGGMSTGV